MLPPAAVPPADSPISFARPDREHEALAALLEEAASRVIRSGRAILGPEVNAFERELASFLGAPFAVGTSSGSDALVIALHALGIGPSDEVLVGAFGFVAGAEAVVRVGATPVFVDIEPSTLSLNIDAAHAARTSRSRAILSTNLFGVVHDLAPLRERLPGLPIIEDAAQALGSTRADTSAGCHGDIGIFSFFPSKTLGAIGDAGAAVTSDADLAARMKRARAHGASAGYDWIERGGNYRLDELQAALLRVKLAHLPPRIERRRAIGDRLVSVAHKSGVEAVTCPGTVHAPLAIRIPGGSRDRCLAALRARSIDARVHYPVPVASSVAFAPFAQGQGFPEAHRASRELLSLPCHPELSDEEVERLARALSEVLGDVR